MSACRLSDIGDFYGRNQDWAMSQENVEIVRRANAPGLLWGTPELAIFPATWAIQLLDCPPR